MDHQRVLTSSNVNVAAVGGGYLEPRRNQQLSSSLVVDEIRLSPVVELGIVGGLGFIIVVAPNIAAYLKRKLQVAKERFRRLKNCIGKSDFNRRLQVLNRRRKTGSVIRVIGSVLPGFIFSGPYRVFIPEGLLRKNGLHNQTILTIMELELQTNQKRFSENEVGDGVIEAYEVGSSEGISVSSDDDDDQDTTSIETWADGPKNFTFNPTLNGTDGFARCSTPKGKSLAAINFDVSQATSQHECSRVIEDPTENCELRKMVEGLILEMNNLRQTLHTTQTQLAAQQSFQSSALSANPSSQNQSQSFNANANVPPPPPPLPSFTTAPSKPPVSAGPPPPPPPPPPMPPLPMFENKPLVITKKGNQDKLIEKKPQLSLSDVLKELPNAKLRRVERSPGGTPVKPGLKLPKDTALLDIEDQLKLALMKRYESMHSPVCDTDTDKENESTDDSFNDNPKRKLFPSPRKSFGGNSDSENRAPVPFGQHILKSRNKQEKGYVSPLATLCTPLRGHN